MNSSVSAAERARLSACTAPSFPGSSRIFSLLHPVDPALRSGKSFSPAQRGGASCGAPEEEEGPAHGAGSSAAGPGCGGCSSCSENTLRLHPGTTGFTPEPESAGSAQLLPLRSDPDAVGVGVSDVSDPALRWRRLHRGQAQEADLQPRGRELGQLEAQADRTHLQHGS